MDELAVNFEDILPMREWLAIEKAAFLADAGFEGEAESLRFTAGYHANAIARDPR